MIRLRLLVACAVLVVAHGAALAQETELPEYFGPETGYPLDDAGFEKLASAIRKDMRSLDRLRPAYADCRSWMVKQSDAIRLFVGAGYVIDLRLEESKPLDAGTRIVSASWPRGDGDKFTPDDLEELEAKKELFREGLKLRWALYADPKTGSGRVFGPFAAGRDRWAVVFKPGSVLSDENFPQDPFTVFAGMLGKGDYDTAYELLSTRITEQMPREDLPAWVEKLGWGPMKKLDWDKQGRQRMLDGTWSFRYGRIFFADGREASLRLYGVVEQKELRIVHISIRSFFGISAPAMFAPEPEACRSLIRTWVRRFVDSYESGEIEEIRANCVEELAQELTKELWLQAFETHIQRRGEFAFVGDAAIEWKEPPGIKRDDPFDNSALLDPLAWSKRGSLFLAGWLVAADGSRRVPFLFQFRYVDDGWKVLSGNLQLPEPVPGK